MYLIFKKINLMNSLKFNTKMSICMKYIYFPTKLFEVDLWHMSNGKKSLHSACCIAYGLRLHHCYYTRYKLLLTEYGNCKVNTLLDVYGKSVKNKNATLQIIYMSCN